MNVRFRLSDIGNVDGTRRRISRKDLHDSDRATRADKFLLNLGFLYPWAASIRQSKLYSAAYFWKYFTYDLNFRSSCREVAFLMNFFFA